MGLKKEVGWARGYGLIGVSNGQTDFLIFSVLRNVHVCLMTGEVVDYV